MADLSKESKTEIKVILWFFPILMLYYLFNLFLNYSEFRIHPFLLNTKRPISTWYYVYFISIHLIFVIKIHLIQLISGYKYGLLCNIGFTLVGSSLIWYLWYGDFSVKSILTMTDFTGWTKEEGYYHPLHPNPYIRKLVWFVSFIVYRILDIAISWLVFITAKKHLTKAGEYFTLAFFVFAILNLADYYFIDSQFEVFSIPPHLIVSMVIALYAIIFHFNEDTSSDTDA